MNYRDWLNFIQKFKKFIPFPQYEVLKMKIINDVVNSKFRNETSSFEDVKDLIRSILHIYCRDYEKMTRKVFDKGFVSTFEIDLIVELCEDVDKMVEKSFELVEGFKKKVKKN